MGGEHPYSLPGVLPELDGMASDEGNPNVIEARDTGVFPYQRLRRMEKLRMLKGIPEIEASQFQPASLDLRLGRVAYRVRASFLPGPKTSVMDRIKELDGLPPIDLDNGAVFEKGAIYVVPLSESVNLNVDTFGVSNPKSSTGRLDVLTRLITNDGVAFDRIEKGYVGPLFLEVAPLSFSIVVRTGARLNQVRFHRERGLIGGVLKQQEMERIYSQGQLVRSPGQPLELRDGILVPVTVDLEGERKAAIVGYKAKRNANKVDIGLVNHYDPKDFWDKIESTDGRLNLDEGTFYILATREDVGVPPQTAAEMVPYDARSGEFRVHYAGFFDPGFGWVDGKASGSRAVLEVRSYGVPFTLEHGQIVGWLRYFPIAGGYAAKLYGDTEMQSSYQGQGVALAKQFKAWCG